MLVIEQQEEKKKPALFLFENSYFQLHLHFRWLFSCRYYFYEGWRYEPSNS